MADQGWRGDDTSWDPNAWANTDAAYDGYYTQAQGVSDNTGFDANEYWRVDADVYPIFLELAPSAQGESVDLGELPELCRRVGRPLQDDHEQFRLMQELDTTNSMLILRRDFVNWLVGEIHAQERARAEAEPRAIPIAAPAWEEVAQEVAEVDMMLGSQPTVFFYNTLSGESLWELPSLVRCLWNHLEAQEAAQQEAQVSRDGVPAFVRPRRGDEKNGDDAREMVQQLRELFVRYDDDKSGYLDPAEFEDLCVCVGQALNGREGLLALMGEVDPYSIPVPASDQSGQQPVVSWEALRHYWVTNAPFQRRTRLGEVQYASWERVDVLHKRTTPVLYRHTITLQERWGHPAIEQRVAERLNNLFPSSKLDWAQKIDLFIDVQWQQQGTETVEGSKKRQWNLETCWRMFVQLNHPMSRRQHVQVVMQQLQQRFGASTIACGEEQETLVLDEAAVRAWMLYCTKKVDMGGWEEVVDVEGQTYYYHEVDGTTQWDPPQLQTQMASMLSKLGGGQQNLSVDEQIARIFRQYDADESGEMTLDEFQHFYRALLGRGSASSGTLSDAQIRQVFSVLDASGDGAVTVEEFQLWWKTKLQLEIKESNEVETMTRDHRRRDICRKFLENADAIILSPNTRSSNGRGENADSHHGQDTVECFESNLLPRLVALLGEFSLCGLVYRRALNELVEDPVEQLVSLERFLVWYDRFETAEREKVELQRAKQRAQAELRAQQAAQAAAREKQRRRRKQMRTLNVMNEQAKAITGLEAQQLREKKIAVLFKTFDTDGSGLLDESELLQLTKALGHEMDAAQVSRMMKGMDSSGDGRINLEEFLAFWKAFEHRRPAAANAAILHQTRRDAVSEPATAALADRTAPRQHLTTGDAMASLAVNLEMVKDKALKLTLADLRGFLSDWRDEFLEKRIEQQIEHDEAEAIQKWRELHAFVPTRKRVYGAKRFDVTWIEPEVVDCVAAIITDIGLHIDPNLKPDAAQRIQALVRGHLARKHVLALVRSRFQKQVDIRTRMFYFTDTFTGNVLLTRPVYPTSTSSVAHLDRDDCASKAEKYLFDKRLSELRAKKRFYDQVCLPLFSNSTEETSAEMKKSAKVKADNQHRPKLAFSAFYMYDVTTFVQQRLLGNIWTPLRSPQPELVLVELIARRRRRQLMQRGRDAAANLPLHYAVRHPQFTFSVIRAIVAGYPEALAQCDAFGMTPLHIAFREKRSNIKLLELLARRPPHLAKEKHGSTGKSRRPHGRVITSVWVRQTVCGDTPLHVAILHRASVGVLQWAFRTSAIDLAHALTKLFNDRGESVFHSCITQQQQQQTLKLPEGSDFSSPRSRTAVLLFFKHFDKITLCSTATTHGDLPLHLAMDGYEEQKQRSLDTSTLALETGRIMDAHAAAENNGVGGGWFWLVDLLLMHYPEAVLTPKRSNGLLPVHLAIKYGFPEDLTVKLFVLTTDALQKSEHSAVCNEESLLAATTIARTRTSLLQYALVHQPRATCLHLMLIDRMPASCAMASLSTGDLPIHIAAAAHGLSIIVLLKLCEVYNEGCRTYNIKRHLPLHVTLIHDAGNIDKAMVLLQHCQEMIVADTEERRGLRALLMAANARKPDYRVLLELLDVAPSRKLAAATGKKKPQRQPVTPLYALSLRRCTPEITHQNVAKLCHDKFEDLEDEDAYFLAMAKSKLRKQHYNPTPNWTFAKILELVERNPLDEGVIQRSLHATNEKLRAMINAEQHDNVSNQEDTRKGYGIVVNTVTLDSDLMLVRTVHQIMYEFPANPRLQLLGQAILGKLLPSAYVRAAYKAKIDPYFNL
ncbi:unnamed protein product [Phytophthora lilii]|uniref:Unnamed protein product n=1 Tax=Phytophthora lilii TaxID=2077276 RepID=A0A9W6TLV7_9STRA|nr:unnamed protein product [Phytophthora lilii]